MTRKVVSYLLTISLLLTTSAFANSASNCVITQTSITVDQHPIYYLSTGQSNKTVLLVHGLFASADQWRELMCPVANAGYHVIALDLPGYGKSLGFPMQAYQLSTQVALLHDFMHALNLQQVNIAGNSMGGAIAALYTEKYPDSIISLAFIGSPEGFGESTAKVKYLLQQKQNPFIPRTVTALQAELKLLFYYPPKLPLAVQNAIVKENVVNYATREQIYNTVMQYTKCLKHFSTKKPTLILWGASDKLFPINQAFAIHLQLAKSQLVFIKEAGHVVMMDQPQKAAALYVQLLNSVIPH